MASQVPWSAPSLSTLPMTKKIKQYNDERMAIHSLHPRGGGGWLSTGACLFHPSLEDLHDPFLMKDMDLAVKRLNKALGRKEHIMIYGDYDVDGTTAVSLIYKYLRSAGCSEHLLSYYIPGRDDEGYGVSYRGVDYAHKIGATLIIVVDCGIKAIKEIAYAKTLGIDFIICDHHHPDDQLPDAAAVLDPKRPDCHYPFEELCGCGVAFKFMQAFGMSKGVRSQWPTSSTRSARGSMPQDV